MSPSAGERPGPLSGVRVIEMSGLGPTPFGCMMLADLGADVIRIDRVADVIPSRASAGDSVMVGADYLARGRRRVALDIEYIERQSLMLDLIIMAQTLPCLLGDDAGVR